jgi:hypothetical protein
VKLFVIKIGHFYKGLSKDLYNINKLMVKKEMIITYLTLLKNIRNFKNVEFSTFENSKYVHLKIYNFKTSKVFYHI